ncbi:unnamed protein product, partial [marine sediment metagenome]
DRAISAYYYSGGTMMISKTSLKQTMVREIWPNIRKHEIELAELLAQLSQLGDENTILKFFFLHNVSLFPKILSNLAW